MSIIDEELTQYPIHMALLKDEYQKSIKSEKWLESQGHSGDWKPKNASINFVGEK